MKMFVRKSLRWSAALLALLAVVSDLSLASEPATKWLKINVTISPSPRGAMAMAYDGISKKIILFGGFDATSYLNDTWAWDGAKWTQISTANAPSPRAASGIGFDQVTGKIVLFGGFNGSQYLGDTWLWDGSTSTWIQANPSTLPTPVTLPMMFTDPLTGHIDQFGGYDGFLYQDITWRWTGTDWSQIHTDTIPYARGAGTAVYDPANKNVVLYGGLADINPNNTWSFDGTDWTELSPAHLPTVGFYLGSSYDPILQQVIVTGGFSSTNISETWAWNGTDWAQLTPQLSPSGRVSLGLAFDQASQQLLMFGGQNASTLLNGTFKLVKR